LYFIGLFFCSQFFLFPPVANAFEDIKEQDEKNSILSEEKIIDIELDDEPLKIKEPGFFTDSTFLLHFRSYLFDQQSDSDVSRRLPDRYSVATGGWFSFKSGYYKDWLPLV